ncbi:MAG: hypothetical protein QOJ38_333 [Solirubrobacterales bacterium]|jgi:hypothetical protein|nr:hypothetical protein [Solirubrobacterales bacterium]
MSPTEIHDELNENLPENLPEDLIAALRAERPQPSGEFAARLDADVAERFPRRGTRGELSQALSRIPAGWPRIVPAVAGAAALVIAIGIAVAQPELGGSGQPGQPPSAIEPVTTTAPPSAGTAEQIPSTARRQQWAPAGRPLSAPAPSNLDSSQPGAASLSPRERDQLGLNELHRLSKSTKIQRSAQLTLASRPADVEDVADRAFDIVDRHRGIVRSSSVSGGDTAAGAELDLLIPSRELTTTVAELSDLAHVRSRTAGTQDVTQRLDAADQRLNHARAKRQRLLDRLANAPSTTAAEAIRAQLRLIDSRIDGIHRRLAALDNRVRMTPLQLSIVGDSSAPSAHRWGIGDAAHDALRVLAVAAGAALVGLAVLVPLALLAALYWTGHRALVARSRRRALDERQPS